jgi:L-ribulose-5-phosphate 4-epimerase
MLLEKARQEVAHAAQRIYRLGLVRGTAGNVSARDPETGYLLVTPSAVPYELIGPEEIIVMTAQGAVVEGRLRPSSEVPLHTCVYQNRSWAHGIVHTHSVYATTFACPARRSGRPTTSSRSPAVGFRSPAMLRTGRLNWGGLRSRRWGRAGPFFSGIMEFSSRGGR